MYELVFFLCKTLWVKVKENGVKKKKEARKERSKKQEKGSRVKRGKDRLETTALKSKALGNSIR